MKKKTTLAALATAILMTLLPVHSWASSCSLASTAGNWAYSYTGTIFTHSGPLPAASVGHYHQDLAGSVSGSQTRSVAGNSGVEEISGTISVNKNCTASATIDVSVNGQLQRTAVLALAFDSNENHWRMIFVSLTLPDGTNVPVVLSGDANRITFQED
jgi:hypothetical protein